MALQPRSGVAIVAEVIRLADHRLPEPGPAPDDLTRLCRAASHWVTNLAESIDHHARFGDRRDWPHDTVVDLHQDAWHLTRTLDSIGLSGDAFLGVIRQWAGQHAAETRTSGGA